MGFHYSSGQIDPAAIHFCTAVRQYVPCRLKVKIDSDLLAREVAIFAERSDVAEEITRLNSHLQQFDLSNRECSHT